MNYKVVTISWVVCCALNSSIGQVNPERQWAGYMGNLAKGYLDSANLPGTWSVEKAINIKWRYEIPGMGLSSPVIWGDKLFLTTAVGKSDAGGLKPGIFGDVASVNDASEHEWRVICLNRLNGKLLWEVVAHRGVPMVKRHPKSTHANSTVATDGKVVVAFFGSEGLYCFDMEGKLQWKKSFGKLKSVFFADPTAEWEFASSPIIHRGVVLVQCDVLDNSFVAAYDSQTGREIWHQKRDEYPGWCTPNIYHHSGKTMVVVNGFKHRGAYDFLTGREVWRMTGGGDIPIPTPVVGKGLVYFNSAHGKQSPIMAVKTSATGDITLAGNETASSHVAWFIPRGGSYMQTMLLYRDCLYNLAWNGTLWCLNPATGEMHFKERIGGGTSFTASPVASDGQLYMVDDNGVVYTLEAGKTLKIISTNPLGDICMATPAIAEGAIYFRTAKALIAIGK